MDGWMDAWMWVVGCYNCPRDEAMMHGWWASSKQCTTVSCMSFWWSECRSTHAFHSQELMRLCCFLTILLRSNSGRLVGLLRLSLNGGDCTASMLLPFGRPRLSLSQGACISVVCTYTHRHTTFVTLILLLIFIIFIIYNFTNRVWIRWK